MVPVYTKPNVSKRRKNPGARNGHQGVRRKRPTHIDERKTHRLECCPHCRGELQHCERTRTSPLNKSDVLMCRQPPAGAHGLRPVNNGKAPMDHRLEAGATLFQQAGTRLIEDIPEIIEPVVTEHTIHRHYCPHCRKHVEPVVPDAMPKATLGHIALTSWLHYGLGLTINQVVDIPGYQMRTKLTPGGLVHAWRRRVGGMAKRSAAMCSGLGTNRSAKKPRRPRIFTRTKPDGGSTVKRTGYGVLRTIATVIT